MQLTEETLEKYEREAPELVAAVYAGDGDLAMRRDPETDDCVKFDQGLCGIHRDYGDAFLGDACHFFPRITRALGATVITSATLSCPEAARQMLSMPDGLAFTPREEMRTPYSLKNYLPSELTEDEAVVMHQSFLAMVADETVSAEQGFLRISTVARALDRQPVAAWPSALPLYVSMADGRIPAAEAAAADMFNLLHAFRGLVMATPKPRARLMTLIDGMADALGAQFEPSGGIALSADAAQRAVVVLARMREQTLALQPVWRRYVQAQLSQALFPFAGLGNSLGERITVIGVRLATVKLALAATTVQPKEGEVVETIQLLSRFMDHLADAQLSLAIYTETGWVREPRLRALISE